MLLHSIIQCPMGVFIKMPYKQLEIILWQKYGKISIWNRTSCFVNNMVCFDYYFFSDWLNLLKSLKQRRDELPSAYGSSRKWNLQRNFENLAYGSYLLTDFSCNFYIESLYAMKKKKQVFSSATENRQLGGLDNWKYDARDIIFCHNSVWLKITCYM